MGAIIGALIGRHLAHTEEQHQAARQLVFAPVASYLKDPASSPFTPEQVDQALTNGMQMNYFPKEFKGVIGPILEAGKSIWVAAHQPQAAPQTAQAPAMGVPNMSPGDTPAAAPAPTLPPPPAPAGPQASMAGSAPPAPQGGGFNPLSMMGANIPAPSLPQASPPPVPGPSPFGPVGAPPSVPFDSGAGPGPTSGLPGEKPGMRVSSVAGTTGFGGPPPATVPAAMPAPVTPAAQGPSAAAQPDPAFWHAGRSPADIATTKALADTQAQIAAARMLAGYGHERVTNALNILEQMGIDRSKLTPTQLASYIQDGKIPEVAVKDIPKESTAMWIGPDGQQHFAFGQRPAVTTPAGSTTTFLDNPKIQPGVAYGPDRPMPSMPASAPGGASMTVAGQPKISDAQRAANAMWETAHGTPITPDKYGQAKSEFDEAAITKSARQMQNIRAANLQELRASRVLRERQLNQTIREFDTTKGPAAIDSLADQVYQNPDYFEKLTGDVSNLVGQRFTQKYNLPPPRKLPTARKDQEDASIISLNHAQAIRPMLNNPVVQQRLGAWDGRLGTLEQTLGDTAGLSDADSRAIQDVRSRLNYFFAQESKSAFGGRTAKEFLDELKESSPRMSMGMPLIQGALDAAEGMAKINLKSAQEYRFNMQPGSAMNNPPAGTPGAGKTYKFMGSDGKPLRVPISSAEEEKRFLAAHPDAKLETK